MMATQSKAAMTATDKMIPMLIALGSVAPPFSPTICIILHYNTICSHINHV